jgi:uncharacterized membrane protein YhaH (DUF805 family)
MLNWSQLVWPKGRGRIGRDPFWAFILLTNCSVLAIAASIAKTDPDPESTWLIGVTWWLLVSYVNSCIFILRLHDIDRSGWWALPLYVPAVLGAAVSDMVLLNVIPQEYIWIAAALSLSGLGVLYFGLKRGTDGPNRFGQREHPYDLIEHPTPSESRVD